ncbi:MAG: efflux RND transporter periplasmic adaptor subunit [Candidatus Didemnitutus sp.]|nr:efflux RND transporter periplasmic adaptor subunit [Candidatus Didemnitutus sp.]
MNAFSLTLASSKFRSRVGGLLVALLAALTLALSVHAAEQLYTCGMHPQIIKNAPGDCPICGMKLTPIRANTVGKAAPGASSGERTIKFYKSTMIPGEVKTTPGKDSMGMDMVPVYEDEDQSGASAIQIDPATIQRMNLKTGLVSRGPVRRLVRTVGTVEFNEAGHFDVTTKYEGWIEKLLVNTTWSAVKAGDPLFEIYSPDLYNAQLNYLVARRAETEPGALSRAARARLALFDVSDDFVEALVRKGEPSRTYVYRAPTAGVVVEKMAVQGQMMQPGERIYRLADLSSVWVHAQIYERDLGAVVAGQAAEVRASYGAERVYGGTVAQLLPQVEAATRAATARLVIDNADGSLRPGMFVDVRFRAELAADAVLVPDSAVLRSGERNTVFVALDGGSFEPREVKLGARTDDYRYAVLEGLSAGERVVISGQFMLDSESQLREAIQKMLKTAAATSAPSAAASSVGGTVASTELSPAAALIKPLALAAADVAAALAADDFDTYRTRMPALRAALDAFFKGDEHAAHGPLAAFKDGLPVAAELASARKTFEPFSTAVADLAAVQHLTHTEGLRVYECTMAPETGKARWLQRDAGTKNPFYGSEMLTCGDLIAGPEKARE